MKAKRSSFGSEATYQIGLAVLAATPGIYCIRHEGGKIYIGSSINVERRLRAHFAKLAAGKHENEYLQRAYQKYGREAFTAYMLEPCAASALPVREAWWFKELEPFGDKGFNIAHDTEHPLRNPSPETYAKMCASQRARPPHSAETRAKMRASMTGHKMPPFSAEHRAKIGAAVRSRPPISEETRAKLRARPFSAEHRAKLSAAQVARRPPSAETRAKIGAASSARVRQGISEETRAKMSAAAARWCRSSTTPEIRAKISAGVKAYHARKRGDECP